MDTNYQFYHLKPSASEIAGQVVVDNDSPLAVLIREENERRQRRTSHLEQPIGVPTMIRTWLDDTTGSVIQLRTYTDGSVGMQVSIQTTLPLTNGQKRNLHANDALEAGIHVVDKMSMIPDADWKIVDAASQP